MPLFESQERRLKRIFKEVLEALLIHVSMSGLDAGLVPLVQKLTNAGWASASVALTFEPFKSLWPSNEPDRELRVKAMMVTEVFTLAMISRYLAMLLYRGAADSPDFEGAQNKLIRIMVLFFADHEPESLEYFLAVNRQHQVDIRMETPHGYKTLYLADLLYFNEAASRLGDNRPRYPNVSELPLNDYSQAGLIDRGVAFFDFVTQVTLTGTLNIIAKDGLAELVPNS